MKAIVEFLFSDIACVIYAVILGALRVVYLFAGIPEGMPFQVYKDIAHLFFGGIAVSAWTSGSRLKWGIFWVLGLFEAGAGLITVLRG